MTSIHQKYNDAYYEISSVIEKLDLEDDQKTTLKAVANEYLNDFEVEELETTDPIVESLCRFGVEGV